MAFNKMRYFVINCGHFNFSVCLKIELQIGISVHGSTSLPFIGMNVEKGLWGLTNYRKSK